MKVKDLKGNVHSWSLTGHIVSENDLRPRSSLHLEARKLLKELFPAYSILEEVPLPGTQLTLDFFIREIKLGIEVDGQQHYKYIPYFHGSLNNFLQQRKNDREKEEWLNINNIQLIRLGFDNTNEWRERIEAR